MKSGLCVIAVAAYLVLTSTLLDFKVPENIETGDSPTDLIVHEWGTFTSVAGKDGMAIDWRPLKEKSDLPTFVYTSAGTAGWRGSYHDPGKGRLAKVRMETPVIYFYTANEMEVDVKVSFPGGTITEWYPQAGWVNARHESGINWGKIKLLPGAQPAYLREAAASHYYPARATDAVAVQVCNADKTRIEKEKFLFYRGVGSFGLPLAVKIDGRNLTLKDLGTDEVKNIIVFENRGGRIGFRFLETLPQETVVERPETNRSLAEVFLELEKILVAEGLYEKEARAMIETWKDSWFEEGLRVFYVLTRKATDKILPLTVSPEPRETVRVLVGRAEVITPETERDVRRQIGLLLSASPQVRARARRNLGNQGRFFEPVLQRILAGETDAKVRLQIEKLIGAS